MRTPETECKRLEEAVEHYKREINDLIEDRDYYLSSLRKSENIVFNLLKDKERLDWLLREHKYIKGYINTMDGSFQNREEIDEAMKGIE